MLFDWHVICFWLNSNRFQYLASILIVRYDDHVFQNGVKSEKVCHGTLNSNKINKLQLRLILITHEIYSNLVIFKTIYTHKNPIRSGLVIWGRRLKIVKWPFFHTANCCAQHTSRKKRVFKGLQNILISNIYYGIWIRFQKSHSQNVQFDEIAFCRNGNKFPFRWRSWQIVKWRYFRRILQSYKK